VVRRKSLKLYSKIWISFGLLRDFFWSASQKPKEEQKKPWRGAIEQHIL